MGKESEKLGIEDERLGKESEKLGIDKDELVKRLGIKAGKLGIKLGKSKVEILWMMYQNPTVTIMEMVERLQISSTAVEKHISEMRDIFLKNEGGRKFARWEVLLD